MYDHKKHSTKAQKCSLLKKLITKIFAPDVSHNFSEFTSNVGKSVFREHESPKLVPCVHQLLF
jgi:hypothetical protein